MGVLLVRTPAPYATESLSGYFVRLCEENGYETPRYILQLVGLRTTEGLSTGGLAEKLASIVGMEKSLFSHMTYCEVVAGGKRQFKVLGQSVGSKRSPHPLSLSRPHFCIACIEEKGFVEAFFDLHIACACPVHKQMTLRACKNCGRLLNNYRPGLLKCQCGARFTRGESQGCNDGLSNLMAIVRAKVHRKSDTTIDNETGLPIQELIDLSLEELVTLIPIIGRFSLDQENRKTSMEEIVNACVSVLESWPENFHGLIKKIEARVPNEALEKIYRERRESFHRALFGGKVGALGFKFLREEFMRYKSSSRDGMGIDGKIYSQMKSSDLYACLSQMSKMLKVRPITIRRWADRGLIKMKQIPFGNQKRYIFATEGVHSVIDSDGRRFDEREAGAYIGLPVSVLRYIRNTEYYPALHRAIHKAGYHEKDLVLLKQLLLDSSDLVHASELAMVDCIPLSEVVMKGRFWSYTEKAKFVVDYLAGAIRSVGRTGERIEEIWFSRKEVTSRAASSRAYASVMTISQLRAGARIGCSKAAIRSLVKNGHLVEAVGRGHVRISKASIDTFSLKYISVLSVARSIGTSARRLSDICRREKILAFSIINAAGRETGFIERTNLCFIDSAVAKHPVRFPKKGRERKK